MFDFMGVMGYEVGFVQFGFQGFVVFDQSMGDVQMDCIGLVGGVVVSGGDQDVEVFGVFGQFEWLVYDYVCGFMIKEFVQWMIVDGDVV